MHRNWVQSKLRQLLVSVLLLLLNKGCVWGAFLTAFGRNRPHTLCLSHAGVICSDLKTPLLCPLMTQPGGGVSVNFFRTRSRTIFLLKGGPTGRLPASCMSFLSNAAGGLSIKKTQGNLWLLKEIPSASSRAQRRPFVPRHVSHTFRAQISSSFMKPRFIFAHCNVPVGSGNTGKHCRCTGNTLSPPPTHLLWGQE